MSNYNFKSIYDSCELCPHRCRADRSISRGFCGSGTTIRAAKAMLHLWEEPSVGEKSGTVFFSGCTLRCIYCQNYKISQESFGTELSTEQLAQVFLSLQAAGADNIDLVTPTHFLPGILEALHLVKGRLHLPVVYNCGGYERKEIIEGLEDEIDIWLPDVKYYSSELSGKYSGAADYFERAMEAAGEMLRQVRKQPDRKKLIIRHMVLPGQKEDSIRVLRELADQLGTEGYQISLLSQYTPFHLAKEIRELNRRLTSYEYQKVLEEAQKLGFDGFLQERTSARQEYTPEFDLSGLPVSSPE